MGSPACHSVDACVPLRSVAVALTSLRAIVPLCHDMYCVSSFNLYYQLHMPVQQLVGGCPCGIPVLCQRLCRVSLLFFSRKCTVCQCYTYHELDCSNLQHVHRVPCQHLPVCLYSMCSASATCAITRHYRHLCPVSSVLARICLFSKIGVIFFLKELFAKQGSYSSVRKLCRYVLKFRERCHLPSIYATCVGPIYSPNH